MPNLRIAAIDDAGLERLVCDARDHAGRSGRLFGEGSPRALHFAQVQNAWADIYQELLDRRRLAAPATHR